MKLTTEDIIKMLPFEEEFKNDILSKWDTYSEDQRFALEQIIWDTYADFYKITFTENTEKALIDLADGKEEMDTAFYQRVKNKTDDELKEMFQKSVPAANLAEMREELQNIANTTPQPDKADQSS